MIRKPGSRSTGPTSSTPIHRRRLAAAAVQRGSASTSGAARKSQNHDAYDRAGVTRLDQAPIKGADRPRSLGTRDLADIVHVLLFDGGALDALWAGFDLDPPGPFKDLLDTTIAGWPSDHKDAVAKSTRSFMPHRVALLELVQVHARSGRVDLDGFANSLRERGLFDLHARRALGALSEDLRDLSRAGDFSLSGGDLPVLTRRLPELADRYLEKKGNIPKSLPALELVKSGLSKTHFSDCVIVCAQHLLPSQRPLFTSMVERGCDPKDVFIAGVPYSTNGLVEGALRGDGFWVEDGHSKDPEVNVGPHALGEYEKTRARQLDRLIERAVERAEATGKKLVVLDDGGLLNKALHERFPHVLPKVRIVEQTTRGLTEAAALDLKAPVVNVAKSPGKNREGVFIARSLLQGVADLLGEVGLSRLEKTRLCVVGFGTIGAAVAKDAREHGMTVTVVEKSAEKRAEARAARFEVAETIADGARDSQVLLGCTGRRSINETDLAALPNGIIVASGSSAEVEIDVATLGRRGRSPLDPRSVHLPETVTAEYAMASSEGPLREYFIHGRSVLLARNGRPVNFTRGAEDIPAEQIQLTRALMFQAAVQAASLPEGAKGLIDLDVPKQATLLKYLEKTWRRNPPPEVHTAHPRNASAFEKLSTHKDGTAEALIDRAASSKDARALYETARSAPQRFPRVLASTYDGPRLFTAPKGGMAVIGPWEGVFVGHLPLDKEAPTHVELLSASKWPIGSPSSRLEFVVFTQTPEGRSRGHLVRVDFGANVAKVDRDRPQKVTMDVIRSFESPEIVAAEACYSDDPTKVRGPAEGGWHSFDQHRRLTMRTSEGEVIL